MNEDGVQVDGLVAVVEEKRHEVAESTSQGSHIYTVRSPF